MVLHHIKPKEQVLGAEFCFSNAQKDDHTSPLIPSLCELLRSLPTENNSISMQPWPPQKKATIFPSLLKQECLGFNQVMLPSSVATQPSIIYINIVLLWAVYMYCKCSSHSLVSCWRIQNHHFLIMDTNSHKN